MASEIKMPQLSDTMHAGKILSWRKQEGDTVNRGDVLAEVETEKANLEIEAFLSGTLLKILVPAQSTAKVGEAIAFIGQPGESVSAPTPSITPNVPVSAGDKNAAATTAPFSSSISSVSIDSDRIKASPLARRVAQEKNVDLSLLHGSGPSGRIIRKDVEAAQAGRSQPPNISIAEKSPTRAPSTPSQVTVNSGSSTPLSKMREVIARRMQESMHDSPHFYTTISVDMQQASKLRETLKGREDFKGISVNHLIIKAAAYGLFHEPRVNCAMRDGQIWNPGQINIGIITALDDGLLIPVLKSTDQMSLRDTVFEARAAVERARAGRPSSTDLVGGTFSISNMGMFDVENFTAIINPGQGAVLAVSATKDEAVVVNGELAVGRRMRATLSVDHRIIDGIMAARFLKFFKEGLEVPALLMGPCE